MRAAEIKKGNVVEHNNAVWQIRDIERSSPQGRGGNVTFRFTMYSVPGGQKLDLSLRAEDELKEVELVRRQASFSYKDGEAFVFLDAEDYTPYQLDADVVGEDAGYIVEGLEGCFVQLIDDAPVALQLPANVTLEVVDTPPELKGGTATKRPKPARLNTGIEIMVPEYITNGERILVSTNIGSPASLDDTSKTGAGTAFRNIARRVRGEEVPFETTNEPRGGFLSALRRLFGGN